MREWFVYFPPLSYTPQIIPVTIHDEDALLTFLYLTIGCESVETVHFSSPSDVLIVDEEGLLKDRPQVNLIGSALSEGYIVSGVVIAQLGTRNGEPDIVGFPDMVQAAAAASAAKTIAQMRYQNIVP